MWNSQTQNEQNYPMIRLSVSLSVECHSYSTLPTSYQQNQILYNQLRIGHTRLTHLIEHTDPPKSIDSSHLLFVKHILTECTFYDQL